MFCLKAPLASTPVTLGLVLAASVNAAIPIMAKQQLNSLGDICAAHTSVRCVTFKPYNCCVGSISRLDPGDVGKLRTGAASSLKCSRDEEPNLPN